MSVIEAVDQNSVLNLANLTGKHLCWSLCLIKLQALRRFKISELFKNTFSYRTTLVAASGVNSFLLCLINPIQDRGGGGGQKGPLLVFLL